MSCREVMRGEVLLRPVAKDGPLMIDDVDTPYATNAALRMLIFERGLPREEPSTSDAPAV
jgi:N-acetylneuraminate synthase